MSWRQFPFFPYIASDYCFLGLAVEWEFESTCWVISHLEAVTAVYRQELVEVWAEIFRDWQEELDGYLIKSEEMRTHYAARKRRFPLLHRNGGYYLVSPESERMEKVKGENLRRYGPYR